MTKARRPGYPRTSSPRARRPSRTTPARAPSARKPAHALSACPRAATPRDHRIAMSDDALLLGLVFLIGFRIALNIVDGNVIDVGYASVVGGDRILHGGPLYGGFPADIVHGDTYGPLAYLAYAPFVLLFGWGGTWGDLPAAHAAALVFDLACIAGLWIAGRRLGGRPLGLLLAYLWAACPFTLLVANSGSNDALVAALVLAAYLALGRPALRGVLAVAAGLTKFAPLALVPLIVGSGPRRGRAVAGAAVAVAATAVAIETGPGLALFWDRTLGYQQDRDSPFSIWGLYDGLGAAACGGDAGSARAGGAVAFLPRARRGDGRGARRRGPDRRRARARPLVLPLPRVVPAAPADRAARPASDGSAGERAQDRLDRGRAAVGAAADHDRVDPRILLRRVVALGHLRAHDRDRLLAADADHAAARAGHADVGDVRGALGRTRASAVGTCVCVPTTAATLPSRYQPSATFSLVASACMSTSTTSAPATSRSASSMASSAGAACFMKRFPERLTTPSVAPSRSTRRCPGRAGRRGSSPAAGSRAAAPDRARPRDGGRCGCRA